MDSCSFEFLVVKFLDCRFQVVDSLVFDKTSTITITIDFRIDNVQSGLTGEVFEILD
jgi:hypothetical protein